MDNTTQTYHGLKRLENLDDWKVHHDDVDVRGYDVYTATVEKIGKVTNLIADPNTKHVRYLEIEADDEVFASSLTATSSTRNDAIRTTYSDDDRHLIIPVGMVRIDTNNDRVVASHLTRDRVPNLPRHSGATAIITPVYEIDSVFYQSRDTDYQSDSFDYDDYRNRYGDKNYIDDQTFYKMDHFAENDERRS